MNEPRLRDDLPVLHRRRGRAEDLPATRPGTPTTSTSSATRRDIPRKLDALAQRCEEEGRDRSTLETSYLAFVMMDEDGDKARALQKDHLRSRGVDLDAMDDAARALATDRQFAGTPDEVAEQLQKRVLDAGVDGIVFNMVGNGHVPGVVDRAARAVGPLVGKA